jgi:hypothetical protein
VAGYVSGSKMPMKNNRLQHETTHLGPKAHFKLREFSGWRPWPELALRAIINGRRHLTVRPPQSKITLLEK